MFGFHEPAYVSCEDGRPPDEHGLSIRQATSTAKWPVLQYKTLGRSRLDKKTAHPGNSG